MKKTYALLGVGLILLIMAGVSWRLRDRNSIVNTQPVRPPAATQTGLSQHASLEGQPVLLKIPSLNMTLPIINGAYDAKTHQWTLSLDKVQYAVMTPLPNNQAGNTFLYGHYRSEVFARLHEIPAGAQASVDTQNGHTFTYQLTSVRVTSPTDTSLFKYKGPPILTIQTCSGLFFQHRQLFTFKLVKAV
ncbi:MAG TPA: sortase [Candidatus Saccharimonadales bacterium]|nr:sortase [Candidatus Saccharimonadales bacterium]